MITVRYEPWKLRGPYCDIWQVYVEISNSHNLSQLRELKRKLNDSPVRGVVLLENSSRALARMGNDWKELDHGVWYKIFT